MADLAPFGTSEGPRSSTKQEQKHQQAKSGNSNSSSYEVSDAAFQDIFNPEEPVRVVIEKDYNFAHEAPVYLAKLNKLFFVSNRLGDMDSAEQHIQLLTHDLSSSDVEELPEHLTQGLPMPNGATNWPGTDDTFVLLTQGRGSYAPAINKVNLSSMSSEVLLDSFEGRQFNSPNDVVLYCDGSIWFTDPPYGHAQNFRPSPEQNNEPAVLPASRVYAFNPATGAVSVVAEDFEMCNGIAFSPDFKTLYVTDTGDKSEGPKPDAQTIYAFDVVQSDAASGTAGSGDGARGGSSSSGGGLPRLENRRVFAVTRSVKPDGIKVDTNGNVYTGTHDGVEVFAPSGKRLGNIQCGRVTNLAFVSNTLYCLGEKKLMCVKLKAAGAKLP